MDMTIEEIRPENRERALALVLSVFMQYEAPDYSIFKVFLPFCGEIIQRRYL